MNAKTIIITLVVAIFSSTAADAHRGREKHKEWNAPLIIDEAEINDADRAKIEEYIAAKCAQNECNMKHENDKNYTIDRPLRAPSIEIPDSLREQITVIDGYEYVIVENDILLVAKETRKVVDAVTAEAAQKE